MGKTLDALNVIENLKSGENEQTVSNDLLNAIRAARDAVHEARKTQCTCSGFILQYEGKCQCGKGKKIKQATKRLEEIINSI